MPDDPHSFRAECQRAEERWAYAMRHGEAPPVRRYSGMCECGAPIADSRAMHCRQCAAVLKGLRRRKHD